MTYRYLRMYLCGCADCPPTEEVLAFLNSSFSSGGESVAEKEAATAISIMIADLVAVELIDD